SSPGATMTFDLVAGRRYTLQGAADMFTIPANGTCSPMSVPLGGYNIQIRCQPAIDTIPPEGGTFAGTTSGDSHFAASCADSGQAPEHVYAWTPSVSGTASISTCGSNTSFDTVLYVNTPGNGSAPIACADDSDGCAISDGSGRGSRVNVDVTAGTTYYIYVDGWGTASGDYS